MEQIYYVKNGTTGLYWNGKDFTSTINKAKKVDYYDLPIIKMCWSDIVIVYGY